MGTAEIRLSLNIEMDVLEKRFEEGRKREHDIRGSVQIETHPFFNVLLCAAGRCQQRRPGANRRPMSSEEFKPIALD